MSLRLKEVRLPLARFELKIDATFDRPISGVFGSSGAGKTSLLEMIAGLRRPVAGLVQLNDEILSDAGARVHVPPQLRRIGYVPQDLALFPHLNVRANLLYGHRPSAKTGDSFSFAHVTEVMEIGPLCDRSVGLPFWG